MQIFTGLLTLFIVLFIYFMPALIANQRKHPNQHAIMALNLLTGWTGLGWIGAIVWAFTGTAKKAE